MQATRCEALPSPGCRGYPCAAPEVHIRPLRLPTLLLLLAACGSGLFAACGGGQGLDPLDRDHDDWIAPWDCDDLDPRVNPDALEVCNQRDDDCDGVIDGSESADSVLRYRDADGDGAGNEDLALRTCEELSGYIEAGGDCADGDPLIGPLAEERCDGVDNDCDDLVDETDAVDRLTWWLDEDGDGFGTAGVSTYACDQPEGWSAFDTDCDDSDPDIHPDAPEVCDPADRDEDCDGLADVDDPDAEGLLPWTLDQDGDGFGLDADALMSCEPVDGRAERGGDCDDQDDGVHPEAAELCGNAQDDDCDGLIDGADPDSTGSVQLFADVDGDGFGDPLDPGARACDLPTGWSAVPTDCDDGDETVNPDAVETWYDGVDQDCDGDDGDADGDGILATVVGGEDCDDGDPGISPLMPERCDNGVDDDCDGETDPCGVAATLSGATDSRAGQALAGLGDIDGDGIGDLLVGADHAGVGGAGAAWLARGPLSGTVSLTTGFSGEADADHLGLAVAGPGDVDGDGLDDLFLGAPDANGGGGSASGLGYLVLGPASGTGSLSSLAHALLLGEDADDRAGAALAGAGDLNDDGALDLVIGAPQADPGGLRTGVAYVLFGPVEGEIDLWFADGRLLGQAAGDEAGASLAGVGDIDGDGQDDLLIGAPQERGDDEWTGAAYLVLGPAGGETDLADAEARIAGAATGDRLGEALAAAGDVDLDGYRDLLLGAPERDLGGEGAGAAYLLYGPVTGAVAAESADLVLVGATPEDRAGSAVLGDLDLDGDGRVDLVVGADSDDAVHSEGGAVYLVLAPGTGTLDLALADMRLDATADDQGLGRALTAADLDGDGRLDLVVGAPGGAAAWMILAW